MSQEAISKLKNVILLRKENDRIMDTMILEFKKSIDGKRIKKDDLDKIYDVMVRTRRARKTIEKMHSEISTELFRKHAKESLKADNLI